MKLSTIMGVIPRFDIIKLATLVLYNVNQSYDGLYKLLATSSTSEVRVFIAGKDQLFLSSWYLSAFSHVLEDC